jgi:photosystem II stability/assembly factor-like uncharacterized protein
MRVIVVVVLVLVPLVGCVEEEPPPPEPWIVQELGTNADFLDVFFLDEQRGWIVGGGHNIEGGILGSTTDGGRTWSFRSGIARPSRLASSFRLSAVWFLDETNGFIVGDGFQILATVDGGENWHRVSPARRVSAHLRDLQFLDDRYGWAIGMGGFSRTLDGGKTWRTPRPDDPDAPPPPRVDGMALHFVDRYRGWLVGKFGEIRGTTDGGMTWTLLDGPPATGRTDLWGVDFVDPVHGWAVGESGTILHTADGGETWSPQESGVTDRLMDVDFYDEFHGWAVGFERPNGTAVVLWTEDGGTTWTEQARVFTEEMLALFVLDEDHAWAVGKQQRRTADDGTQKILVYSPAESESEPPSGLR